MDAAGGPAASSAAETYDRQVAEQLTGARLVGRDDELGQIHRALEAVSAGDSRTVMVGGEAGIGKSRLVREALSHESVESFLLFCGACRDFGTSPLSFGPILEALRPLARQLDDETRRRLLDPLRERLAGLGPAEGPAPSSISVPAGSGQAQLFEMALTLLEGLSDLAPVVVVIEDVHWADRSTRNLLSFLVPNLAGSPVALVLTHRSDELVPGHETLRYLAQLQRNRGVLAIHLRRLDREELSVHLEALLGGPLDYEVFETIWTRSQGNPFYAEELLALSRTGDVNGMPTTLRDLLLGRIRMLAPATQRVLRLAATGGMTVDYRLLAAVADGMDDEGLEEAVRQAVDANILVHAVGSTGLSFRHALLREVAYRDMLPSERRSAHARYGRHLRNVETGLASTALDAELARHHVEAGEHVAGLLASLGAATSAATAHGYAESRIHLERAIDLWRRVGEDERPSGVDLVDLLERAAGVAHLEGDNQRAVELARAALAEQGARGDRAQALSVHLAAYLAASGQSADAPGVLEEVVSDTADAPPSALRAEMLVAYARSLFATARHWESVSVGRQALEIARAVNDRAQEAQALTTIGSNLVVLGEPEAGVADLYRGLALAEEVGAPSDIATGYRDLANTLSGPLNRLEEALEVALRGVVRVSGLGLERHWGVALRSTAADTLFRLGRWDEAEQLLAEAIQRSPKGAPALDLLLARAKLAVGRGYFDSAAKDLAAIRRLSERAIDLRYQVPLHTLEAGLALWQGAMDEARAAVQAGLHCVREADDVWFVAPLVWHGLRAEAERAERARANFDSLEWEQAAAAAHELRAMSARLKQKGAPLGALQDVVQAYDLMCEGELRRALGEASVDAWAGAAGCWDALGHRYPAAYARCRWAESLLSGARGAGAAAPLLALAHGTARELGALPLIALVERLGQAAGIDLAPEGAGANDSEPSDGRALSAAEELMAVAGLTRREAQVLELVAAGDSNRRIAQALFISEKTASVHVSHIMSKLKVSSRVQAAALLHRCRDLGRGRPRSEAVGPVTPGKATLGEK